MEEEDKQYLSQVGMYLADLFYNQKNINMKEEMLEEAAENYAVQFLLEDEQETDSANRKQAFKAGAK